VCDNPGLSTELPLAAFAVVLAFRRIRVGVAGRNEVVTKLKTATPAKLLPTRS
jgi:hypothetical protein